jgi:hypothetical protein
MSSTKSPTPAAGTHPTGSTNGVVALQPADPADVPNPEDYVTEDGKPVDHLYVEKLYKLLIDPLYLSYRPPGPPGRPFLATSNVGWFYARKTPPTAPDIMLSLEITPLDPDTPAGRSYFQWEYVKPPDLVIEIISDKRADEDGEKLRLYERQRLTYYVIHDPFDVLGRGVLRAFGLTMGAYVPIDPRWIPTLGLGLVMWDGTYQGMTRGWLRWCDEGGNVLPTGEEMTGQLRQSIEQIEERVETVETRAETAEERVQRLLAQLRAAGIEPQE